MLEPMLDFLKNFKMETIVLELMAKTKSRKEHYVDNKKLFEAMKDFKELCKEKGRAASRERA